jgi:hypothetical protein
MRPGAINGHFHPDACAPVLDDDDDRIANDPKGQAFLKTLVVDTKEYSIIAVRPLRL